MTTNDTNLANATNTLMHPKKEEEKADHPDIICVRVIRAIRVKKFKV